MTIVSIVSPLAGKPVSRLGVIGDVHAEDSRLQQALDVLASEQVDAIVCTGDIVDGVGCADESVKLLRSAGVFTVKGNHDRWLLEEKSRHVPDAHFRGHLNPATIAYLEQLPGQLSIETVAGTLLLCHGIADNDLKKVWPGTERMPIEKSIVLDQLIAAGDYQFIINGHMHFRTLIHFHSLTLINAGTLRGLHWPGFSIIDFARHEVKAFEFKPDGLAMNNSIGLGSESHQMSWRNTQEFTGGWQPVRFFV